MRHGLVMLYLGKRNSHSNSAIGQILRSVGRNTRVIIFDFSGNLEQTGVPNLCRYFPTLNYVRVDQSSCDGSAHLPFLISSIINGIKEILLLYDISDYFAQDPLFARELIDAMRIKSRSVDVILSGSEFPQPFIELADLITETKHIKN